MALGDLLEGAGSHGVFGTVLFPETPPGSQAGAKVKSLIIRWTGMSCLGQFGPSSIHGVYLVCALGPEKEGCGRVETSCMTWSSEGHSLAHLPPSNRHGVEHGPEKKTLFLRFSSTNRPLSTSMMVGGRLFQDELVSSIHRCDGRASS